MLPALTGRARRPAQLVGRRCRPAHPRVVVARDRAPTPPCIVVQPTGVLEVREIVVPLDLPITKFDNAQPDRRHRSSRSPTCGSTSSRSTATPKQEDFAVAQFTDLSDADKVSAPSYELFDAGVRIGDVPLRNGKDAPRTIQYVTKIIDDYQAVSRLSTVYRMPTAVHAALINTRVAAATASTGLRAFAPNQPDPIVVDPGPVRGGQHRRPHPAGRRAGRGHHLLPSPGGAGRIPDRPPRRARQRAGAGDARGGDGMTGPTDDEFGRHHFLAWARQGIATTLDNPDYGTSLPDRPTITVDLDVTAQNPGSVSTVPTVTVHTFGPGDVLGIDPRQVVRTEPKDSTPNFEPNYLAGIEFDTPDFPWLFTPAAPAGDRLRPWITLIVLKGEEFNPVPAVVTPLPAIDVLSTAGLQSLDDAWNWAHTQVSGDAGVAATGSAGVISRLLCPRRLDPETTYTAFVVPTFDIGRQAGLGLDVSAIHTSDPAWTSATGAPLRLPVFYRLGLPHRRPGRLRVVGPPAGAAQVRGRHRGAADGGGRPDARRSQCRQSAFATRGIAEHRGHDQ